MNEALVAALHRTLLLMRDEFGTAVSDETMLDALTGTRVAIVADPSNICSHAAQTAFVTAAILMARSGHQVYLIAPNVEMELPQPPLRDGRMIDQLLELGRDVLPGVEFTSEVPTKVVDLVVVLGNSKVTVPCHRAVSINCSLWSGQLTDATKAKQWGHSNWPFGAMVAGAFAAAEAFKAAMNKLMHFATSRDNTKARFEYSSELHFKLADEETPLASHFGLLDFVSGGAITHATLFSLARVPEISGVGRIYEADNADTTNLNRYVMLRCSDFGMPKALQLVRCLPKNFVFTPVCKRFDEESFGVGEKLSPIVMVGVDHIPSRWFVQSMKPEWLVIGATSHWCAMSSFHSGNLGCAKCLHPRDEDVDGPIPTCAVVSFWAGLLVAASLAQHLTKISVSGDEQQIYFSPFRMENPFRSSVPKRITCDVCGGLDLAA